MSFIDALQILFIYLKLTNQFEYNWFIVMSPMVIKCFVLIALKVLEEINKAGEKKNE